MRHSGERSTTNGPAAGGGLTALVVYESMFGCTAAVAGAVAEGLASGGLQTRLVDVREAPPASEMVYDVLVVGAPTHAFSLSRPSTRRDAVRQGAPPEAATTGLREWLDALGGRRQGHRRAAAAFDTRVAAVRRLPKAASTRASRMLVRHGHHLVSRPTPFLVEGTQGPLVEGELTRAATWGRVVAVAAQRRNPPTDPPARTGPTARGR
jgi:hypothetical protein